MRKPPLIVRNVVLNVRNCIVRKGPCIVRKRDVTVGKGVVPCGNGPRACGTQPLPCGKRWLRLGRQRGQWAPSGQKLDPDGSQNCFASEKPQSRPKITKTDAKYCKKSNQAPQRTPKFEKWGRGPTKRPNSTRIFQKTLQSSLKSSRRRHKSLTSRFLAPKTRFSAEIGLLRSSLLEHWVCWKFGCPLPVSVCVCCNVIFALSMCVSHCLYLSVCLSIYLSINLSVSQCVWTIHLRLGVVVYRWGKLPKLPRP